MKEIIIFILFISTINSFGQNSDTNNVLNNDTIYEFYQCDEKASFHGGNREMMQFVADNFKHPNPEGCGYEGTEYLQFEVTKTGEIGKIIILRSLDPDFDKEAIRVVQSFPKWLPAKKDKKPINSWFIIPVRLHFQ
jgi:TonB family protein